jgi:hypothetical protein
MITDQQFNKLNNDFQEFKKNYQQHQHNGLNGFKINPKDLLGFPTIQVSNATTAPTDTPINGTIRFLYDGTNYVEWVMINGNWQAVPIGGNDWCYQGSFVFTNQSGSYTSGTIAIFDYYKIIFNFHNTASTKPEIYLQMNGITASNYSFTCYNAGIVQELNAGGIVIFDATPLSNGYWQSVGEIITSGKHSNGLKTVCATVSGSPANILLNGTLGSDSNNLTSVQIGSNVAITGEFEFWAKNNS